MVGHDKEVPFRLLRKNKSLSLGEHSENLIVEGDNLEALKALLPFYYGKVKCIYIDPPYNTGNEKWVYNDRVNSGHIREWLGKVVGPEGEDLTRHDKWLCMMYPRLKLLHQLLRDDGVIFISIDDNEHCNLKMIMDDIFGSENFVANIVWENKEGGGKSDSNFFRIKHEYILVYAKEIKNSRIFGLPVEDEDRYKLADKYVSTRGKYQLIKLDSASLGYVKSLDYPIKAPDGKLIYPNKDSKKISRWRWGKEKLIWGTKNDFVVIKQDKNNEWAVYTKQYLNCDNEGNLIDRLIQPIGVISKYSTTQSNRLLKDIFGEAVFNYSKPIELIEYLIELTCDKNSLILDSFAGSGTTAHAVMELNKEDGGDRKFILVEMEKKIAREITQERVRRVAKKLGKGDFEYAELGVPLFKADGNINEKVSFEEMASYVYFTETLSHIDKRKIKGAFIGEHSGTEYYLLFKQKDDNILNRTALKGMKKDGEEKVVYADKCLLSEEILNDYNITFKQIPYQVRVY